MFPPVSLSCTFVQGNATPLQRDDRKQCDGALAWVSPLLALVNRMSKLPQVNVRLAPEHHGLIREIAQRLRADPSLAIGIADFLAQTSPSNQPQVSPLPHGLADEITEMRERLEENRDLTQALQERLMIQSEGLQRTTAYADLSLIHI